MATSLPSKVKVMKSLPAMAALPSASVGSTIGTDWLTPSIWLKWMHLRNCSSVMKPVSGDACIDGGGGDALSISHFSFFKLLDVAAFANAYQSYDIIASKFKIYGYVYPFIELLLGFAYLFFYDYTITNSITAIIMFVSIIGVIRSVLSKSEIQCACLGTVLNLPMSYVTIIEDAIMLIMALFMLF